MIKVFLTNMTDENRQQENINTIMHQELSELDPPTTFPNNYVTFSIRADNNTHIGLCAAYNFNGFEEAWIGIRISNPAYWGKGCGTEVIKLLVNLLIDKGIKHVKLQVLKTNARAIRCYQKCGFVQIGDTWINGLQFDIMEVVK